ncbi:uncharacterized protein MP3633_0631 [Marinomonas primoryensis]|uniref:Uncharacterized protein n=1 Tax=Marinomonas primoryensis TaxID=178399 RepID=A0A859CTF8_9GAMM|nr:uncharacterized protein MP3633_0631 [Marinomonas primoryensis]
MISYRRINQREQESFIRYTQDMLDKNKLGIRHCGVVLNYLLAEEGF